MLGIVGFIAAYNSGLAQGQALPGVDGKWRYFSSPNFELYSRNPESESRELLHNLELLRAVFLEQLKLEERVHVPVTVYSFRSKDVFRAYLSPALRTGSGIAGFHLWEPDRAVISLAPAQDFETAQQTIFHEYVHHLFQMAEAKPPLWFNEGTAEVFAGIRVEHKQVQIGTPVIGRLIFLQQERLMPLEQLFSADRSTGLYKDETHTGVFYAEAWALLHFWRFGDSGFSKESVERFLRVASDSEAVAKVDLRSHFRACFGCDYPEMQRRLDTYVRRGSYRYGSYPMPKLADESSYAMRAVPVDEITRRLAELSVRVEHSAASQLMLMEASTQRPDDPRSLEVLGTAALQEHDEIVAAERWERALAAGSKNPAVVRELALLEGRRWFEQFEESLRLPVEVTTRMRTRLLRSIEIEPGQGAAYEMLAWVEAFSAAPLAKNINQVIAHLPTMRDKRHTLIALAAIMLRMGRASDAVMMLDHLDTLRIEPQDARALAVLRSRLEMDFPDAVSEATPPAQQQMVEPPPSTPGLKTPSVALPDDL